MRNYDVTVTEAGTARTRTYQVQADTPAEALSLAADEAFDMAGGRTARLRGSRGIQVGDGGTRVNHF